MRRVATILTSLVATAALAGPALVAAAHGAPHQADTVTQRATKLKLKKSAPGFHAGQAGVVIKAVSKKKKGKIVFSFAGQSVKKKLKKGKAKIKLPSTLAPGKYTVKAKVKGYAKAKTKVEVYNSSISLDMYALSVSNTINPPCSQAPTMTGTVTWKGAPVAEDYIVTYLEGTPMEGGSSSPGWVQTQKITNGVFTIEGCRWGKLMDRGVGVYTVRFAFSPLYGDPATILSDPVTVTITP